MLCVTWMRMCTLALVKKKKEIKKNFKYSTFNLKQKLMTVN